MAAEALAEGAEQVELRMWRWQVLAQAVMARAGAGADGEGGIEGGGGAGGDGGEGEDGGSGAHNAASEGDGCNWR